GRAMKDQRVLSLFVLALLAAHISCSNRNPTAPQGLGQSTWTGLITYSGGLTQSCPSSERITVAVNVPADGSVTATFSSGCYGDVLFLGQSSAGTLAGQLRVSQKKCLDSDGYVEVVGQSTGTLDASHIHLETRRLSTSQCDWGSNVIDLRR
ncbi:MAG TPA: hypothetical protein VJA66_04585, partial [Thermoanaerobaculia bacterium]